MVSKKRREFKIEKIGNYFYLVHNSRIKRKDYFVYNNIVEQSDIRLEEGDKIYASNDPTISVSRLPSMLVAKLNYNKTNYLKLKSLTLKVEEYNFQPEIVGGAWDGGSYEYDIRPVVDKNNCIIVEMWKI